MTSGKNRSRLTLLAATSSLAVVGAGMANAVPANAAGTGTGPTVTEALNTADRCTYSGPGSYSVTMTATDTQKPAQQTSVTHTVTVVPSGPPSMDRYDGTTRYGTGIAVSQAAFPAAGSANAVVLARGDLFADALAGIPLAKAKNGPLLLTPGGAAATRLDPNVEAELVRVLPKDVKHTVYVLGGTGAISQPIEDYLSKTLGYTVVRLAGDSRFDTALAVAQDPRALNNPGHVVVARGDDFADALAAGPYAANAFKDANSAPAAIILSSGAAPVGHLDGASAAYVASKIDHKSLNIAAVGGGAAAAVSALPGSYGEYTNVSGQDRYATAAKVAAKGWGVPGGSLNAPVVGVATGTSFADALTGGAYMALKNGPLLLSDSVRLSQPAGDALAGDRASVRSVDVFGGTGVLGSLIEYDIRTVLQPAVLGYVDHHVAF
jgi:putative cell wall-binding protein